jgi:hypothetical protein
MSATLSPAISAEFVSVADFKKFFSERQGKTIRGTLEAREQPIIGVPGESCKTNPYGHPSRSHALLSTALCAAAGAKLQDEHVLNWCEWFWQHDQLEDLKTATATLQAWCGTSN